MSAGGEDIQVAVLAGGGEDMQLAVLALEVRIFREMRVFREVRIFRWQFQRGR